MREGEGVLTWEFQGEYGGFFGDGGITSCGVAVRHHRF